MYYDFVETLFFRRCGKDDLVFAAGLVVDGVDGINYIDNVLHRNGLIGTEHHTGIVDTGADARLDERLEAAGIGGSVANLEVEVFVDINGDILLGHSFAAALGKEELDGIGADEGGSHHEEYQEKEHQVGHGGVVVLDGEFIASFDHSDAFLNEVK